MKLEEVVMRCIKSIFLSSILIEIAVEERIFVSLAHSLLLSYFQTNKQTTNKTPYKTIMITTRTLIINSSSDAIEFCESVAVMISDIHTHKHTQSFVESKTDGMYDVIVVCSDVNYKNVK